MYYPPQYPGYQDPQNPSVGIHSGSAEASGYQHTSGVPLSYPALHYPAEAVFSSPDIEGTKYKQFFAIGKATFGKVYLAETGTKHHKTLVAMKAFLRNPPMDKIRLLRLNNPQGNIDRNPPTSLTLARKEATLMAKCCHPNIVRFIEILDDPQDKKNIHLVMEYLGGGPIVWQDENEGPILTLPQTRRIIRDITLGLEYLHHEGIVHRDIKPGNVMWTEDRQSAKLIDFGIAHYFPPHGTSSSSKHGKEKQVEQTDAIDLSLFPESDLRKTLGTPAFLAPEIVWIVPDASSSSSGSHYAVRPPITKSVDMWSLGVTLYCLVFGHLPFDSPSSGDNHQKRSEYLLYQSIGTQDWSLDWTMGSERIPTNSQGGDEPAQVAQLLDLLLQKAPEHRITVEEVKSNPWLLSDIPDPQEWLRLTSLSKDDIASDTSLSWLKSASKKFMKLIPKKNKHTAARPPV